MDSMKLENIKGNHLIFRNDEYVVLAGKKLWIFRLNGALVACRADLSNIFKVAFLHGDRLLTDGGKKAYHIISLKDGSDLQRFSRKKHEGSARSFALSPDGTWAYDYSYWNDVLSFVKIDLINGSAEEYPVSRGLSTTKDIMCDENGVPCLLQTQYANVSGEQISENGILYQYQDDISIGNAFYWKYKWQFSGKQITSHFLGNTEMILTNDLYVYQPKTGEMYYLLENDTTTQFPATDPSGYYIDHSGKFIVLTYDTANVVVDWNKRKVVACYAGQYTTGCLVENQFWISSESGIQYKPFPLMEDIPAQKYTFWKPYQSY